jgi:polysaccharide biosynthesis protein PslG
MTPRVLVRRQIRGFVTAWTALTGIIAVATFFAIYLTYGGSSFNARSSNIALPVATNTSAAVALNVTAAPTLERAVPATNTPEPTITPTEEAAVEVAAVAQTEEAQDSGEEAAGDTESRSVEIEPTLIPIEDTRFQAGIQVQRDLSRNRQNMDNWMREVKEKMGFGWFKLQVRWEEFEPTEDDYQFGELRFVLNSAKQFGLKVMVSVVTAPEWAREPGVDLSKQGPPADPQDYVDFVTEMLNRMEGDIHGIEVWNEQNLDREWMSTEGLSARNYVDLLRQTYQAIKAIDPNIIVVSGALSPGGGWQETDGRVSAVDDFTYMQGMVDAGMLDYADCVGVHHNGYNIGPSVLADQVENDPNAEFRGPFDNPHHSWSFRTTLEGYNRIIQLAGGTDKLCVTEFGWAVTEDLSGTPRGFEFANDNTLEEQAEWTIEALNNMEEWGFVWLAFIWNFNYGPQAGWDPTNDNVPYSIIGPDWVHRPVYDEIIEWQQGRLAAGLP